jgi:cytochrome c oxidase subunit III
MLTGCRRRISRVEGNGALAEQFDDLAQQHDAASLGMWVFLVTEILFFGGLFAGYTVYRATYSEAFREASHHLDLLLGSINTAVLITSSLTMAFAVHNAQEGRRRALIVFLLLTMIIGAVFLSIKVTEYAHKYEQDLVPGIRFAYGGPHPGQVQLFLIFYFVITSLHALHLTIGIGLLGVLAFMAWRGHFSADYYVPVETSGLYWHFIDIVWIFLFPLLYLIGTH